MMSSAILKSKYDYAQIGESSYLLINKNYKLIIDELVSPPYKTIEKDVPRPQILRITLDKDFGSTRDSMTLLTKSPIKNKTIEELIKSSVWSSEPSDYDFRLSIFNLQASEQDSCPICSVFRVREGFNHCSSFCDSEQRERQSRLVELVEVGEEEQETQLDWIKQELNLVKLSITRVRRYKRRIDLDHFYRKMTELQEEATRLMNMMNQIAELEKTQEESL